VRKKILVLTTETSHHSYFVKKLSEGFEDISVFCQNGKQHVFPYETNHSFESSREQLELKKWFDGDKVRLDSFAKTKSFDTLNGDLAVDALAKENADIIIVFGTGRLSKRVLDLYPGKMFNLHGGDPERYRGLDSHLWAIYHQDFAALVTTLHCLDENLDTGDIISQCEVKITKDMPIEALRSANTETCVAMTVALIDAIKRTGSVVFRKQIQVGRYYSAMPSVLKEICIEKFSRFTKQLK